MGRVLLTFVGLLAVWAVMGKEIPDTLHITPSHLVPDLDESEVSLEEAEMSWDVDSLSALLQNGGQPDSAMIPASATYNFIWDTQFVNPYKISITEWADSVLVPFSDFCHPLKNVVTSEFGFRSGWKYHYGIDLRLSIGDSIVCSFDGMVRVAKRIASYGNYVVVRHFNGLETVYAHLSRILVQPGDLVKAGSLIGLGGNTGRSTGPHLHYELRYLGQPLPPRSLIDFESFCCKTDSVWITPQSFAYLKEVNQIRFYTIRKGDTLSGIARKTGVPVSRLCKLNGISTKTILRIGRKLRFT